jgi:putative Holliday junction resolvase
MTGRIVGLDYGERRIGTAVSDPTGTIALPRDQIIHHGLADAVDRVVQVVQNEEAVGVVLGDPRHMSGEPGAGSAVVREVATRLAARLTQPVWLWDERLTSVAAEAALREGGVRRRDRKRRVDAVAAALILQSFLDAHRELDPPPGVRPG